MTVSLPPRVRAIVVDVCTQHCVEMEELFSPLKSSRVCMARNEAMWRVRQLRSTPRGWGAYSYPHIGKLFGRDHSTVLHACRRYEAIQQAERDAA